jgi:hypothetical protein
MFIGQPQPLFDWAHMSPVDWAVAAVLGALWLACLGLTVYGVVQLLRGFPK